MLSHDQIENVLFFQIEKTNKMAKIFAQKLMEQDKMGVTVEQWVLLKIIQESDIISQKELAEFAVRDPASITRTIKLLEVKGLISRNAILRRQFQLSLTENGVSFVKQHFSLIKRLREQAVKDINPKDAKIVQKVLLQMQKNMI